MANDLCSNPSLKVKADWKFEVNIKLILVLPPYL